MFEASSNCSPCVARAMMRRELDPVSHGVLLPVLQRVLHPQGGCSLVYLTLLHVLGRVDSCNFINKVSDLRLSNTSVVTHVYIRRKLVFKLFFTYHMLHPQGGCSLVDLALLHVLGRENTFRLINKVSDLRLDKILQL